MSETITLQDHSGAVKAVNLGLIGKEVILPDYEGFPRKLIGIRLGDRCNDYEEYFQIECVGSTYWVGSIEVPKPSIESLRVGDVLRYQGGLHEIVDFGNELGIIQNDTFYVTLATIQEEFTKNKVKDLELITRNTEGTPIQ